MPRSLVAVAALVGHLFVFVHGASHVADAAGERPDSRPCVVCSAADHAPPIPVSEAAAPALGNLWTACAVAPPTAPAGFAASGPLARAPPTPAASIAIG